MPKGMIRQTKASIGRSSVELRSTGAAIGVVGNGGKALVLGAEEGDLRKREGGWNEQSDVIPQVCQVVLFRVVARAPSKDCYRSRKSAELEGQM